MMGPENLVEQVILDENTFCALIWLCLMVGGFVGWVARAMYRREDDKIFSETEQPVSAESATEIGNE